MNPPALLGDGVPYTPGMPLWGWRGNPVKSRFLDVARLEYFPADSVGAGWWLGDIALGSFFSTRAAALAEARLPVAAEVDRLRAELTAAEARLAAMDAEILP